MEVEDISVARLMTNSVISAMPDTTVEDAAEKILDREIGSLMIVNDDNHLEGILTSTDFVEIVAKSQPKAETTVGRYMSEDIITVQAQDSIASAADIMIANDIQHLPVTDPEEGVIGMLSSTDLTTFLSDIDYPSP